MPTKTKSKKQSKVRRVIGWFKPTSFRKGLLLFVLAFAVVGGLYALKQSKADSWTVYAGTPGAFVNIKDGYWSTDCHSNKGCVGVAKLYGPHMYSDAHGYVEANIFTHFTQRTPVFICAWARAEVRQSGKGYQDLSATTVIRDPGITQYALGHNGVRRVYQSNNYSEFCFSTPVGVPAGNHQLYVLFNTQGTASLDGEPPLDIYSATMKW